MHFSSNKLPREVQIQIVETMLHKKVEELTNLERKLTELKGKIEENEPTYIKLLKEKEAAEHAYISKKLSYSNKIDAGRLYHKVFSHLSRFEIDKLLVIQFENEIEGLKKLITQYNLWLEQNLMEGGRRKTRRGTRRMRK